MLMSMHSSWGLQNESHPIKTRSLCCSLTTMQNFEAKQRSIESEYLIVGPLLSFCRTIWMLILCTTMINRQNISSSSRSASPEQQLETCPRVWLLSQSVRIWGDNKEATVFIQADGQNSKIHFWHKFCSSKKSNLSSSSSWPKFKTEADIFSSA